MFGDLVQECYAREHGLDYQAMLSASDYKERYRLAMIEWSEEIRSRDPGYFCRAAIQQYTGGSRACPHRTTGLDAPSVPRSWLLPGLWIPMMTRLILFLW